LILAYLAIALLLVKQGAPLSDFAKSLPFVGGFGVGSTRWLIFGPISVQPSEFAKILIILYLSNYLSRHTRHLKRFWKGLFIPGAVTGIICGLVLMAGDMSTTALTALIVGSIFFVAGLHIRYIALAAVVGILIITCFVIANPERQSRIRTYLAEEQKNTDDSYQLHKSILALGSGGLKGQGFTESRMKLRYLPEAHTDFIVAIVGEELGFLGILVVTLLYITLILTIFFAAWSSPSTEGTLICTGIGLYFGLSSFFNIAVVSGFVPTTGIAAPFISYGGSSMLASMLCAGLVYSVLVQSEKEIKTPDRATLLLTSSNRNKAFRTWHNKQQKNTQQTNHHD
jgi:cell division protein FtsW